MMKGDEPHDEFEDRAEEAASEATYRETEPAEATEIA